MLQKFFSYIPRSGSRVIAFKFNDYVAISRIRAGTVVAGDVAILEFYTAVPGDNYCRYEAYRLCEEIIDLVGGFAEDNRGTITLIVPAHKGWDVHSVIVRLLPITECERVSLRRQLWRQGLAKLSGLEDYVQFEGEPQPIRVLPGWRYHKELGKDIPAIVVVRENSYQEYLRAESNHQPYVVFITDKGWPISAVYGDNIVVDSPYYKDYFLDITEPTAVKMALEAINHYRLPPTLVDSDNDVYVELEKLTLAKVDDTISLQIYRGGIEDDIFDKIKPLAGSINNHAELPIWAGWERKYQIPQYTI